MLRLSYKTTCSTPNWPTRFVVTYYSAHYSRGPSISSRETFDYFSLVNLVCWLDTTVSYGFVYIEIVPFIVVWGYFSDSRWRGSFPVGWPFPQHPANWMGHPGDFDNLECPKRNGRNSCFGQPVIKGWSGRQLFDWLGEGAVFYRYLTWNILG